MGCGAYITVFAFRSHLYVALCWDQAKEAVGAAGQNAADVVSSAKETLTGTVRLLSSFLSVHACLGLLGAAVGALDSVLAYSHRDSHRKAWPVPLEACAMAMHY